MFMQVRDLGGSRNPVSCNIRATREPLDVVEGEAGTASGWLSSRGDGPPLLNWGNAKDGLVSRHRIAVRVTLWSHHLRYAAAALDEFVPAGPVAVSAAAASQRLWTGAD